MVILIIYNYFLMIVRVSEKLFVKIGFYVKLVYLLMLYLMRYGVRVHLSFIFIVLISISIIGLFSCTFDDSSYVLPARFMVIKTMIKDGNLVFACLMNCYVDCLSFSFILSNHLRTFDKLF